jgi:hypothetical protein
MTLDGSPEAVRKVVVPRQGFQHREEPLEPEPQNGRCLAERLDATNSPSLRMG